MLTHDCKTLLNSVIWPLPGNICVIDQQGEIVAVNEAWMRFAHDNGIRTDKEVGIGVNYLAVCQAAVAQGDEDAAAVLKGLNDVLAGERTGFAYEYPCNGKQIERWFEILASPTGNEDGGAVLCHSNITALRRARMLSGSQLAEQTAQCMCSSCKRVRQENQRWQEIEEYVYNTYAERFSHGICPECMERLYPEFAADKIAAKV